MKKLILPVLLLIAFSCQQKSATEPLNLIPRPNSLQLRSGFADVSSGFKLLTDNLPQDAAQRFSDYLAAASLTTNGSGMPLKLKLTDENPDSEAYALSVRKNGVEISAHSEAGLFYGIQTLIQLTENGTQIPFLEIEDSPRFAYRGLHIDVSRHFFSLDFLKKQIDMMAHYKLNRFHWHLTDGPGWRLEIKKYPELTNIAAWRTHARWKDWWDSGRKYVSEGTPDAYGGYYTQEEARELVRYAAERHITVIPEIEMPGHSEEVLAVYPRLACTGKPYTSSEFCIGNDETFEFLENVLAEVIEIFPSEYIHVGGDEAEKRHWQQCPKCQARIKNEGLKNEAELQSYLIRRIEKFLHSNGRKLVGWDEILEGGLDKSAVVMAWRGEKIGIEAAQDGHKVIMTPGEFMYFDSYQGTPGTQPEAIGGFLPLEKVYSYNPVPDTISTQDAARVWGVQANLWAEYISTEKHLEYMMYPRVLALAEVAWTQPENKSWNGFKPRANRAIPVLQSKGYNVYTLGKEPFVVLKNDSANRATAVELSSELYPVEIRYTTDGTSPDSASALYREPLLVTDSALLKAQLFRNGTAVGEIVARRIDYHHAIGKTVIYNTPFSRYYPAGGNTALIDGLPGGLAHGDGFWQGFLVPELDVVIDMHEITDIRSIRTQFLQNANAWIWFPANVTLSVSDDNESYTPLITQSNATAKDQSGTLFQSFGWNGHASGRYVRLQAPSNGTRGGWLFVDEIVVW